MMISKVKRLGYEKFEFEVVASVIHIALSNFFVQQY